MNLRQPIQTVLAGLIASVLVGLPAQALDMSIARAQAGKDMLLADDQFFERLSPSDIAIRLGATKGDPTVEDLRASYAKGVEDWTMDEIVTITKAWVKVRPLFAPYEELLPDTIHFVKTNAKVDGGLPHTRGNAIFASQAPDERIIIHEVFHILSRHEADRRASLYGLIGFQPCTMSGPQSLEVIRLTNPDTPAGDWYVPLADDPEADGIVAFTHANSRYFNPELPHGFPGHLGFGLVRVKVEGDVCSPVLAEDGSAPILSPMDVEAYFEAIGKNTGYIIHPEEVLADNFVMLLQKTENLPNPEIPEKLGSWLQE